jgi:hypothetical protein
MKKLLSVTLAASLLLYPFAAFAADYGSQTSQTQQVPPVAQILVREGDFAIKLAATLDLGLPTDEAVAEDMLATAGVAPLNGWLSDYPMTPQIIGQLQDSIAKAAAEGKLPMTAEQATNGLNNLAKQMNLATPAASETPANEGTKAPAEQPNSQVINNYYYDQGPPVITYYPPPYYYGYLYDWVPYPVFWFGFWFPGFYICNSFTRVVVVDSRPVIVSNHFVDRHTRRVAVVDPVTRTGTGSVRPETTLRTQSGRTFRNLTDLRNGVSLTGPTAGRLGTSANSPFRAEGFRSSEARRSAGAIYSRSIERMRPGIVGEGSGAGGERPFIAPSAPGRSYNGPVRGGERRFIAPSASGRSYNGPVRGGERRSIAPGAPERSYRPPVMKGRTESVSPFVSPGAPSMGGERRFVGPNAPSRSFSGTVTRGGRHSMGSFPGNGWHGR